MKKFYQVGLELLLVGIAIFCASTLYLKLNLIPKNLFDYQSGMYSNSDWVTILVIYWLTGVAIFYPSKFLNVGRIFFDEKLFVREIFLVILSSTISGLGIFIFTSVFFDPNFILWELLLAFLLFFATYTVNKGFGKGGVGFSGIFLRLRLILSELIVYGFSASGMCIVLISVLPLILAVQFKRDKDFANLINTTRNFSSGMNLPYEFVSDYQGMSFQQPIFIRVDPVGTGNLFVLERGGKFFFVDKKRGTKELTLDFSDSVGEIIAESGALSFAFHPQFHTGKGKKPELVYFFYTVVKPQEQLIRISSFDLSRGTLEDRKKSEVIFINIKKKNLNGFHNGGTLEFGRDGFLYFSVGDGSDPQNYQTITNSLFAGIFRIDVDRQGGEVSHDILVQPALGKTENYMIPNDNPFVGNPGALEEFWALGLRNPFRFSFDIDTGELWAGDVGSNEFEEVNVVQKGGNYQFPYIEGYQITGLTIPKNIVGRESIPIFTYRHSAFERAIIGGIICRGEKHGNLNGKYVFADNGSGKLYFLQIGIDGEKDKIAIGHTSQYGYQGISSIMQTPKGEILITTLGSKVRPTGKILRLEKKSNIPFSFLFSEKEQSEKDYNDKSQASLEIGEIREIFNDNCSRCHGSDGRGGEEGTRTPLQKLPDFTDPKWQKEKTNDHLFIVISKGGEASGLNFAMPPWEGVLEKRQIKGLVSYIRLFKEEN